jgi:hypothetical protein
LLSIFRILSCFSKAKLGNLNLDNDLSKINFGFGLGVEEEDLFRFVGSVVMMINKLKKKKYIEKKLFLKMEKYV